MVKVNCITHYTTIIIIFILLLCIRFDTGSAFANTSPRFALGNPTAGSIRSGIGLISGWVCDATKLEVSFDKGQRLYVPYGSLRPDTESVCGDTDNGFGLLWNFNELGAGRHFVTFYIDGQLVTQVEFNVVIPDTNFLRGVTGQGEILLSDGQRASVQWEETIQGFTITKFSRDEENQEEDELQQLAGIWRFTNKLTIQTYNFPSLLELCGNSPCLIDHNNVAGIISTAGTGWAQLGHPLVLIHIDSLTCRFYVLNFPQNNRLSGYYGDYIRLSQSDCTEQWLLDDIAAQIRARDFPTTGIKINR